MQKIEFTKAATRLIVRQYQKGSSMATIAGEHGVSIPVVRRVLASARVKLRGPGRHAL